MVDQIQIGGQPPTLLTVNRYVLGREANCDIVLGTNDGTVSRQHAALERDGQDRWSIVDLSSTNGVFVNGQRITGSRLLLNGDGIGIGDNQLTLIAPRAVPENHTVQVMRPAAAIPQVAPAPVHASPQQSFCQNCGTPRVLGALFCSGCGNGLNAPVMVSPGNVSSPQQPSNIVNVSVQQKTSNGGWWAAVAVMLFATPLGCIVIPAALILLWLILATGITFAPIVVAIVAAVIVWKHEGVDPSQKTTIVASVLAGGVVVQFLLFASLHSF